MINELRDCCVNGSRNGCGGARAEGGAGPAGETAPPHRYLERYAELDLTVFVACYNEEANIRDTLDTVVGAMRELPISYEIIVIDDCSRDRSAALVEEYQRRNPAAPVRLVVNPKNRGLARNFTEGAFLGRGRYYKLVCGDNVDTRENLHAVFKRLGNADVIVPYHERTEGRSRFRLFLSRFYTALVNWSSGHSLAYYNGCGVYRRADVMRWHSRRSGFGFQADLLTRLLDEGASYVEVPIVGLERQAGFPSALKLRNWLSVGRTLLSILWRRLR